MSLSRSATRSQSPSKSRSRTHSPTPQPHPSSSSPKSHRQTTTPFLLHLFYRLNAYNHLTSFPLPTPSNPNPPLPRHHLQIYTWMSCTLRELAMLLVGAVPDLIYEDDATGNKNGETSGVEKKRKLVVGTRLGFRLVYPDLHSTSSHQHSNSGQGRLTDTENRGRYMCREMGSVVVGAPSPHDSITDANGNGFIEDKKRNYELESEDADKTLEQLRFVIGDYVDVAVFAPLSDGSVVSRSLAMGPANTGNGLRRDMNGYSSRGGRGGGSGGGYSGGYGRGRGGEVLPSGEWRRGERLPDRGGYGAGGGGGGGAGYSSGGGYARGRGPY